ncbi:nicotinate phosphoribosyltransferase [Pseudobacteriovorax antillogorgiicola]|uniref:Nicotinamide phosphoribosyltransferase n=1 Tax=Pseudobacteriovorax antillogorgiicola TaxID=1513793 RepID=A0A1Y6BEQ3_9BACT|nr:nicotinate phosphoribosyltransferase [Pseudobacteriovorax antillogorgiicola]TCS56381.1 nicotinamide phosphoribosyltransferase [Pseudobacteriovorax antillogorgiicola]SMF06398.1 nicotinamide phosphoribosyltransferase [Pseudobacteriovorax antillogorgiicola]
MNLLDNLILKSDSYKFSHFKQYPKGTQYVYSYFESRGGAFNHTMFAGLQYILKRYLLGKVVTKEKIDQAEKVIAAHMGEENFNRKGWEYILETYDGRLPLEIKAVPEGLIIDGKNVLMTVVNTDPEVPWLTNFVETILTHVWAPTTVATQSLAFKRVIAYYLQETSDPLAVAGLEFKLHDFGYRGVSSDESAAILGAAHLFNFLGSDTMAAISLLSDYYGADEMPAFSIPASEHSTITSWGRKGELKAMENMLDQYPTGLVACVSDSFDIFKACSEYWGDALKEKVLSRDGTLVIRPDSGDPVDVVIKCLDILTNKFGYQTTAKGYKLLPPQLRLIQGDGVDLETCKQILKRMTECGYAADNIAFGSGGALLQKLNRDTLKFAFKCSSVTIDGSEIDVYKEPVTATFKKSKRGRFKLVYGVDGNLETVDSNDQRDDVLRTVFKDGELLVDDCIAKIRRRSMDAL